MQPTVAYMYNGNTFEIHVTNQIKEVIFRSIHRIYCFKDYVIKLCQIKINGLINVYSIK